VRSESEHDEAKERSEATEELHDGERGRFRRKEKRTNTNRETTTFKAVETR
jgi:hypothetical protein